MFNIVTPDLGVFTVTVVKVTIRNAPDLQALADRLKSPEDMLKDIQQIRRVSFYNSIATGKDATGKPVKPLTPGYAKYKKKKVGNKPIRVFTGEMISKYRSDVQGNQLLEELDSEIAVYQDATRQLLPRSWDEIPSSEKRQIERAATDFLDDILTDLVKR